MTPHPLRGPVRSAVARYLATSGANARPSAVHFAHLAAWLLDHLDLVEEVKIEPDLLTAAIARAVWEREASTSYGWRRSEACTLDDLVTEILTVIPPVAAHALTTTERPGLTGSSRSDLARIAMWSAQHDALQRLHGKTIGLDFDGTIHTYDRWTGVEPTGEPTPYAVEFVRALVAAGVEVVISTCRAAEPGGQQAVEVWLDKHEFPTVTVTSEKPQAVAYIDDRAVPYRGTWIDCLQAAAALVGTHTRLTPPTGS